MPGCCFNDVKSIASELGFGCKRITNPEDKALKNNIKRDNKTVYVLWPRAGKVLSAIGLVDAVIFWNGVEVPLKWKSNSKASLRKHLQDSDTECTVCLDEVCIKGKVSCKQCSSKICMMCLMKMLLTDETIRKVLTRNFTTNYRCVGCRAEGDIYLTSPLPYFRIMHRLNEFTKPQADALRFMRKCDPNYVDEVRKWNRYSMKYPLPHFKEGCTVQLERLKTKKAWNGKEAVITGEGRLKNGVYRWPILLTDGSEAEALLKQMNLRKI